MQSKRWSHRFGGGLFAGGLFIACVIGAVIYNTAPSMLHPGGRINQASFSGTAAQGRFYLGIFGVVFTVGVTAMLYGLWQLNTGQRSKNVIYFLLGQVALLLLAAALI